MIIAPVLSGVTGLMRVQLSPPLQFRLRGSAGDELLRCPLTMARDHWIKNRNDGKSLFPILTHWIERV
jgi:hypothetical protein